MLSDGPADAFGLHPEHMALILADALLLVLIASVLVVNYRRLKTRMTFLFLVFVLLLMAATLLDLTEHFLPLHPLSMVPMAVALALLLYLLRK